MFFRTSKEQGRDFAGPTFPDMVIRQAIGMFWMSRPEGRKSLKHVTAEVQRIAENVLADFRRNPDAFIGKP